MENTILFGDCIDGLRRMKEAGCKVQTCVTSPPYWGLRQYLFTGACILRYNITEEEKQYVEAELKRLGINPRLGGQVP